MRAWTPLAALPVGPELQLAYVVKWIKGGGVDDVEVILSDIGCARDLYPVCKRFEVSLHLCPDATATATHLHWILGHGDDRFLIVPEDFHPAPGSILNLGAPPAAGSIQLQPMQPYTLYQPRILWRSAVARLPAERVGPGDLERHLLTGQADAQAQSVPWSDALLLRQPAAYLEVCARAQRLSRRTPDRGVPGLRRARIDGTVQIARSAGVGKGAQLRDCVVLPGTPVAAGETLDRVIAFGRKRIQVDGGEWFEAAPERLRVLRRRGRTPLLQRAVAAALFLASAPLLALSALAVKLESRGPVLFRQPRLGQNRRYRRAGEGQGQGQLVRLYKLRTMRSDAEAVRTEHGAGNAYGSGPFFKLSADPRITGVGRLLRRMAIDEIPQLMNVIRGELALVGNRPLPLYEAEGLREPWQCLRYDAPAGITGLWQVIGRSTPDWRQRQFLDSYYAIHRNAMLDASILVRTLPAILASRSDS